MFSKISSMIRMLALFVIVALTVTACAGAATPNVPAPAPTPAPTVSASALSQGKTPNAGSESKLKNSDLVAGVVTKNDNGALTLRTAGKKMESVETNAATLVVIPSQGIAKLTDVQTGDRVVANLAADAKTAAIVIDFQTGSKETSAVIGAVRQNKGGNISIATRRGTFTLATDAKTTVLDLSGVQPQTGSLKNLAQGNVLVVVGQTASDTLNAQVVIVTDQDARQLLRKAK